MVRTYKCPNCGANMIYNASDKMLVCESCETSKTVTQMEASGDDSPNKAQGTKKDFTDDFNMFTCPTCGAEILTDIHTAATFCSYCGSPTLIESRLTGEKTPSYVLPFKITKEAAREAYLKWTRKGMLTPSEFVSSTTIEKITGMYVPFWLYDYGAEMKMQANATRIRSERRGDVEYTHTDHYHIYRDLYAAYSRIPVDASEKMDDTTMDLLEPYHYNELTTFEMGYLAGYQAEKYNYDGNALKDRAERRIRSYITDLTRSTIKGYATVNVIHSNVTMQTDAMDYALMPVWMLNYRFKDKNYSFIMNGQTGKIVGKLPISKTKVAFWFCGIAALVYLVANILGLFI